MNNLRALYVFCLFTAFYPLTSCDELNNDKPDYDTSKFEETMAICGTKVNMSNFSSDIETGIVKADIVEIQNEDVDVVLNITVMSKLNDNRIHHISSFQNYSDGEYGMHAVDIYFEVESYKTCSDYTPGTDEIETRTSDTIKYSYNPGFTTQEILNEIYFNAASFESGTAFDIIISEEKNITGFQSFVPKIHHPLYQYFDKSFFSERLTIQVEDIPWGSNNFVGQTKTEVINYTDIDWNTVEYNWALHYYDLSANYDSAFIIEIPKKIGEYWFYKFVGMDANEWNKLTTEQVLVKQEFLFAGNVKYSYHYKIRKNVDVVIDNF